MPYCAIDFGKREYPFDITYKCKRDSAKILGCINYLARKFPLLVLDRFGILDTNPSASRLPKITSLNLIDYSLTHADMFNIRKPTVCWSGGIDSTFIVACLLHQNVAFNIAYNTESIAESWGEEILTKLESKKISCIKMKTLLNYAELDYCITGDGADILFSPSKMDLFINSPKNEFGGCMSISEALDYVYPDSADENSLYVKLLDYGKKLRRDTLDDFALSRLINWGAFYYFKRDYFRAVTGAKKEHMISFFDTDVFMDISYSSYWDALYEDDCKYDRRKFIASVFGKSLFSKIKRNPSPYLRPSNLEDLCL